MCISIYNRYRKAIWTHERRLNYQIPVSSCYEQLVERDVIVWVPGTTVWSIIFLVTRPLVSLE
jgi:hypothetical protein